MEEIYSREENSYSMSSNSENELKIIDKELAEMIKKQAAKIKVNPNKTATVVMSVSLDSFSANCPTL